MRDKFSRVIYVGKARDLRKRVSQYFHPSRQHGWDLKLNALLEAVFDFDTFTVRSEPEALLLEGKLIKEFKPRYNISFRDDKRFLLLKVNLSDDIPRFTLTRLRQDDGSEYFGPFAHSGSVRRTLKLLRTRFGLRGCRPHKPGEQDYRHCLYAHLKTCLAPCVERVSLNEYKDRVREACDFLKGRTHEMLDELTEEMKTAAGRMDFERAAELRDMIRDMERTVQKTVKFRRLPENFPIAMNTDSDLKDLQLALDLTEIPVRIEGYDISNISGTFKVSSLVSFYMGKPDKANYRKFKIRDVVGQDDFACMAETIRRRYKRLLDELKTNDSIENVPGAGLAGRKLPDLILIDGGRGQLNAACRELEILGLKNIPIIGLAKENEEIYRPGELRPLKLSLDHGGLKLLQRIRDESHRFANSFNAELRLKKISESLLDEFPGIGTNKKNTLLKHFGSLQRLKKASLEEIKAVPGFGEKSSQALFDFLHARTKGSQ